MNQQALGLIETIGYTTAISAADAALKAANVTLVGMERIIGVGQALGVTIHLSGDVAAVTAAVQAGKEVGEQVGKVVSAHVIPRAHNEVSDKIVSQFLMKEKKEEVDVEETKEVAEPNEELKTENIDDPSVEKEDLAKAEKDPSGEVKKKRNRSNKSK
ncbi:BMC domain-containing protein [Thermoflavimicrobium daqui]|jgi:microcompartment protein CcmL/EutN|uniref:BMC domain-containing protein n=1 Tax=Thermoflavimicrobium daqui TaxID=2137476 RepID=A0A364K2P7_9BACL|nr:BMC domain-containing protein [Thermoflavimicrobium daqui]RAL22693.1 BMC domain-containing protein [Thermoflavimicrobium daqui]